MAQSRGKASSRRKGGKRRSVRSGSSLWPWIAVLAVVAGGIISYEKSAPVRRFVASLAPEPEKPVATRSASRSDKPTPPKPVAAAETRKPTKAPAPIDKGHTAAIVPPAPIRSAPPAALPASLPATRSDEKLAGAYQAKFFLCGTAKQDDCVVSADRFVFHSQKIRLVGIEVPDIKKPRCEDERIKASDAKLRVRAFLDSGPFELVTWAGNDAEVDGHKLRDVKRNGMSLSDILVREGLARRPGSGQGGWC